jgi:hypothetical protein
MLDKTVLEGLVRLNVGKAVAERALRAARNDCMEAIRIILMGGIHFRA